MNAALAVMFVKNTCILQPLESWYEALIDQVTSWSTLVPKTLALQGPVEVPPDILIPVTTPRLWIVTG
jgi:hypothetical protein